MKIKTYPTIEPEILHTRLFKNEFVKCVRSRPLKLKVVVPYIGSTPFGGIVDFAKLMLKMECEFHLVTSPPNNTHGHRLSKQDAINLVKNGVYLNIHTNSLHAKLYQFSYRSGYQVAFVGSANFSAGGFERNAEAVAFFQEKRDNNKVEKEICRFVRAGASFINFTTRTNS